MDHVLITGATGAIGSALAGAYAAKGCRVTLQYHRQKDKAEAMARALHEHYGTPVIAVQADVSSTEQVEALVQTASRQQGFIDTLINNAGVAQQKLFTDLTDADWETMMNVDLGGVFRCCRAVLPEMIRRKRGSILNISSMWGQTGASCEVHYSAAKAGVIGLTRALAKETAPSGITVNCIAPGVIRSPMLSPFSETDLAALAEETPLGRLGEPEDIAAAALFLTDSHASFITGQVLGVNGGFVI